MSVVSEYFLRVAEDELREDEFRRSQSLDQFRELLCKHPAIKKCRTDDRFLLQFLRTKKFSTDVAVTLLENHLKFLQKHPKMFSCNDNERNQRLEENYESKVIFPLKQRDGKGRKGLLLQLKNIDAETINFTDLYALSYEVNFSFMEDEETQIAGLLVVIDCSTTHILKILSKISLFEFKEMVESFKNSLPGRIKGLFLINAPPSAQFILEILKLGLSKKHQDRTFILKDHDELKQHFDTKIMPKELGGVIPEAEMIDEFRGFMKQNEEALRLRYDFEIDLTELSEFEKPGSFRKLNID